VHKEFITVKEHEKIIEEERRNKNKEIERLKEDNEKELKNNKERLLKNYKEQLDSLEKDKNKCSESIEQLKKQVKELKDKCEELEDDKTSLTKRNDKLLKQIENRNNKIEEMKAELEGERKAHNEIMINSMTNKNNLAIITQQLEQANITIKNMANEIETLKKDLYNTIAMKDNEVRNVKKIQCEYEEILSKAKCLEEDKDQVISKFQKEINDLTVELDKVKIINTQIRKEDYEKIKEEVMVKSLLSEREEELKESKKEIEQLKNELKENSIKQLKLQSTVKNIKDKGNEFNKNSEELRKEQYKYIKEFNNLKQVHNNMGKEISQRLRISVDDFRRALNQMRRLVMDQLGSIQQELIKKLAKLISIKKTMEKNWDKRIQLTLKEEESKLSKGFKTLIESKENDHMEKTLTTNVKYNIMLKEKDAEITQYHKLSEELKKNNILLDKELNEVKKALTLQEENNVKLLLEKKQLKIDISSLDKKLKNVLNDRERYKTNLKGIQGEVLILKHESTKSLLELLKSIDNLKSQYKYEIGKTVEDYERELSNVGYTMNMEKERRRKLEAMTNNLQQEIDMRREKYKTEVSQLESKVNYLNRSIASDKYSKYELSKNAKVNELNNKLQQVYSELEVKNNMVESLYRESQAQREEISKLRSRDTEYNAKYMKQIVDKEKEIEKLHKLLAKSYTPSNTSLTQLTSRLEDKTKELAKKVQEASIIINKHH